MITCVLKQRSNKEIISKLLFFFTLFLCPVNEEVNIQPNEPPPSPIQLFFNIEFRPFLIFVCFKCSSVDTPDSYNRLYISGQEVNY